MNTTATSHLQIVRRNLSDLKIDPANARVHGERNLETIRASIQRFGQVEPIVIQKSTGLVIGGNARVAILRDLGQTEADVVELDVDDINATALGIALNRTAELGEWNEDTLAKLLSTLQADPDFDHLVTGFTETEIARLQGPVAGLVDPDATPEPPKDPVTRSGDLWRLGEHRVLCGDATDAGAVARLLDGEQPFLMVCDAPYGVELNMEWRDEAGLNGLGPAEKSYLRSEEHRSTSISGDTRADWSAAFELVPSLEVIYAWHASAYSVEVGLGLQRIGFDLRQMIVWAKPHFVLSRTHYHYQTEPAWYAVRKGRTARWCGTRDQSNLWQLASPKALMSGSDEQKFNHPTQKPCEAMERPMRNHGVPGDVVFDPFLGSGTSVIAAVRSKRRCFGLEISPAYVDLIVARWERFTGKTATRISP